MDNDTRFRILNALVEMDDNPSNSFCGGLYDKMHEIADDYNEEEECEDCFREMSRIYDMLYDAISVDDDTSDGFHTFHEMYEFRTKLFAVIVNSNKDISWKSLSSSASDPDMSSFQFIVGIDTPEGCVMFHCDREDWDLFNCKEIPTAPAYNGYDPSIAVDRLSSLVKDKPENGEFYVYWTNGKRVEIGQEFYQLGVGSERKKKLKVTGVSINDANNGMIFVYSGNTGYPLKCCEPVQDPDDSTCYDLNGGCDSIFECSKCGTAYPNSDFNYCPNCGRRIL